MPTARTAILCALAVATGALAWRAFTPVQPFDVHVSGDGAAQIADALFGASGPPRAADPATSGLETVTFRRWQNVETMTGLMRACGTACDGSAPVVVLRRPSLNGLTEVLLIDLGALGAGPALDAGEPMEAATLACVERLIVARLPSGAGGSGAGCASGHARVVLRPRFWTPRPL